MKTTLVAFCAVLTAAGAAPPQSFTGTITDTMCGAKHSMIKDQPDDQCVKVCVKGSAEYALYDGKTVWKLSDQKTPAKFAAAKVVVVGVADSKTMTIKVSSINAAP